jgi:hypothetical protein
MIDQFFAGLKLRIHILNFCDGVENCFRDLTIIITIVQIGAATIFEPVGEQRSVMQIFF